MAEATFTFWEVDHVDLPIDWHDARRRLDQFTDAPPASADEPTSRGH